MKAILVKECGDSSVLQIEEATKPTPGLGEVLIKMEFAGLNFIDVYFRKGIYKAPKLPFIPGKEGVGLIEEIGEGVNGWNVGDRVGFVNSKSGTYAEYCVENESELLRVPQGISPEVACASMLQGMTAHYLANSTYQIKKGDVALVHAASGGVGLLLCQMISAKGGIAYGTVSTEEKKELALKAGAKNIILYKEDYSFLEELMVFTENKKIDVVYDSIGEPTFRQGLKALRPRGLFVLFGQSAGIVPPFNLNELNTYGSLFVTRPSLFHYTPTSEELNKRSKAVFHEILSKRLDVKVGQIFPFDKVALSHDALEGRKTVGKTLIKI